MDPPLEGSKAHPYAQIGYVSTNDEYVVLETFTDYESISTLQFDSGEPRILSNLQMVPKPIILQVFDKDKYNQDEHIGTVYLHSLLQVVMEPGRSPLGGPPWPYTQTYNYQLTNTKGELTGQVALHAVYYDNQYVCNCKTGFTGTYCETKIDYCDGNACKTANTIKCNNEWDLQRYTCTCRRGFAGENCDIDINECASNPCQNGATCKDIGSDRFECFCALPFTGAYCEIFRDFCDSAPCKNQASCITNQNEKDIGYYCHCEVYYNGVNCENHLDYCESSPCNNGDCFLDENLHQYICICPNDFTGPSCNIKLYTCDGCLHYDVCEFGVCICSSGWTGEFCDIDIDECDSPLLAGFDLCLNGSCSDLTDGFECLCDPAFTGERCEIQISACKSTPCSSYGKCIDTFEGLSYKCQCQPSYIGDHCQIDNHPCTDTSFCQNDGYCIRASLTEGACICSRDFTGSRCESFVDHCASSPCQNGGVCRQSSLETFFTCDCYKTGFNGVFCQNEVDDCKSKNCSPFGSRCVDDFKDATCECFPGYTGDRCEIRLDPCSSTPCNNQVCVSLFDSIPYTDKNATVIVEQGYAYKCICDLGFTAAL